MFPGILPDRIRAMLSSWKRPALVALTTFYLSHIAHSGESFLISAPLDDPIVSEIGDISSTTAHSPRVKA